MVDPARLFATLNECGVGFFAGVPDSLLKGMCAYLADHCSSQQHVIAANEGSAVALGIGHHLATGKVPLIYLQNSGLGHVINPLLSLADREVYSIPLLLMVGWRGEPGVADEPQHVKQGRVTPALLDALELPYQMMTAATDGAQAQQQIEALIAQAVRESRPCALLVSKGAFTDCRPPENGGIGESLLSREQAIERVLASLSPSDVVISTTGFVSRELFELRANSGTGHQRDFLTVGGMGHASQIALGVALGQPNRQVYCLDGDGAFIMHMGGAATCATAGASNLKHIVLNNGVHDSVGGQPTVAHAINIEKIAHAMGYQWSGSAATSEAVNRAIATLHGQAGPALLEIKIRPGARSDLGRPTTEPAYNKTAFMDFLSQ